MSVGTYIKDKAKTKELIWAVIGLAATAILTGLFNFGLFAASLPDRVPKVEAAVQAHDNWIRMHEKEHAEEFKEILRRLPKKHHGSSKEVEDEK